jgi:hypothetical protein
MKSGNNFVKIEINAIQNDQKALQLTIPSLPSPNDKIGKLPLFATLRFVKQMFSF